MKYTGLTGKNIFRGTCGNTVLFAERFENICIVRGKNQSRWADYKQS